MERCIVHECGREERSRGLCHACYMYARRRIDNGSTTWEEMEADGRCLPTKQAKENQPDRAAWFGGQS